MELFDKFLQKISTTQIPTEPFGFCRDYAFYNFPPTVEVGSSLPN